MKIISILAMMVVLTGCQNHGHFKSSISNNQAKLDDARYFCEKELQGKIIQTDKMMCEFTNAQGQTLQADAVKMLQDFAKDMIEGDTIKN